MSHSPYNLCSENSNSNQFYSDLSELAEITYRHFMKEFSFELNEFAQYRLAQGEERTTQEYMIELLTLAMVWREYLGGSQSAPFSVVALLKRLYLLRNRHTQFKTLLDSVRGILSGIFIYPKSKISPKDTSLKLENFDRLIEWLRCTGEFSDEVKRFVLWREYFLRIRGESYLITIGEALKQLEIFTHNAESFIGKYTEHVKEFRENLSFSERWREDALFRNKSEVEYHINMVASEIINQGFAQKYLTTSKRVVLVPACMCEKDERQCRREVNGLDISCQSCSDSCNIYRINKTCIENGYSLNIVPHSSSFSKWLKRWENSSECGLVAVACPLNIVVGGYQMRELNIPSQCLMLDYCGCSRHWGPESVPTAVNVERLLKLVKNG